MGDYTDLMRILMWHFRSAPADRTRLTGLQDPGDSAGTDGVSLEMMKRRAMLEAEGHDVAVSSAYSWSEFPIAALEFDRDAVTTMMHNLFGSHIGDFDNEDALTHAFEASTAALRQDLRDVLEAFRPDVVFVHNLLCLPIHAAATVALTQLLRATQIPCVAIHHDILSEGAYKFSPTCGLARQLLDSYYPPRMSNLMHWTINTRNQRALAQRGVAASVIHDTIEFGKPAKAPERTRLRQRLRERFALKASDVILLLGARIVPNKQVEVAGHVTAEINRLRHRLDGRALPTGAMFGRDSQIVLILAGRPERAFEKYRDDVYCLFDEMGIRWIYAGDIVRPIRSEADGLYALYPDMYSMADFVIYPTRWEGFGNQLIEAFAARLPTIVFEYPVYKEDIGPKGFRVVSLADKILPETDRRGLVQIPNQALTRAATEAVDLLCDPEKYRATADHNAQVGGLHFGFAVLHQHLSESLQWAR